MNRSSSCSRAFSCTRAVRRIHAAGHAIEQFEQLGKQCIHGLFAEQFPVQRVAEIFQQAETLVQVELKISGAFSPAARRRPAISTNGAEFSFSGGASIRMMERSPVWKRK